MVKINCLQCGRLLKFPSYIDPEDYDGQIRCNKCKALLYIKFKSSEVKKYKLIGKQPNTYPHDIRVITAVPRPDYSKESEPPKA